MKPRVCEMLCKFTTMRPHLKVIFKSTTPRFSLLSGFFSPYCVFIQHAAHVTIKLISLCVFFFFCGFCSGFSSTWTTTSSNTTATSRPSWSRPPRSTPGSSRSPSRSYEAVRSGLLPPPPPAAAPRPPAAPPAGHTWRNRTEADDLNNNPISTAQSEALLIRSEPAGLQKLLFRGELDWINDILISPFCSLPLCIPSDILVVWIHCHSSSFFYITWEQL